MTPLQGTRRRASHFGCLVRATLAGSTWHRYSSFYSSRFAWSNRKTFAIRNTSITI